MPTTNMSINEVDKANGDKVEDNGMAEQAVNIFDINLPADVPQQTYHQRLEAKRSDIKKLLGETVIKKHKKQMVTWKVVERSIPDCSPGVSKEQDLLWNQVGLKSKFELLKGFRYNKNLSLFYVLH